MQNIFIKIPFVFGNDWHLPSRSNTTLNQILFIPSSITKGNTQPIDDSSVYLDCFISLPVSRSTSSAHTYMHRLLHGSDCSTVSTFCTDNDLGSRVYFGTYRISYFLLPTDLEADIGMTMSACCPSHFWIFCTFADKLMIMGLYRHDKLIVTLCPSPAISWPLISRSYSGSALDLADEFVMSLHRYDWLFAKICNPLTRIIWLDTGPATFIMSSFTG